MPRAKSGKVVNCDECGNPHYIKPYLIRKYKHHFCSNACKMKWMGSHRKKEEHPSWKGGNRNKICDYCGNLHSIEPHLIRKYKHHFCSRECHYKWQQKNGKNGTRKAVACETCGKEIYLTPCKLKYQHHFCSKECQSNWYKDKIRAERVTVKCNYCGKDIIRKASEIKDNKHYFCSNACMTKWMVVHRGETSFPTKPEKRIMRIVKKYNLPFRYVGNGGFKIGAFNPDFINNNGEKQVIEVFGRYWHDPSYYKEINRNIQGYSIAKNRKKIFRKSGYKTLILWDDEMKELSDEYIATKIQVFALSS